MRVRVLREEIKNTRRVERSVKMIKYLNRRWRTVQEISEHLEIHPKSVNRYLNLMVHLGFRVEWRWKSGGYQIYRITNIWEMFTQNDPDTK
jgi:predicted DNA-binding transcriptional regulator YafY